MAREQIIKTDKVNNRKRLIKRLEELRPPCKISISKNNKEIIVNNCPTTSDRFTTLIVNLERLSETPEEYLVKTIEGHEAQICILCGKPAVKFRDLLSAKKYKISKLCQKCQDEVFQ